MRIIFSHGKEGSPESRKIVQLSRLAEAAGHEVLAPDYREMPSPEDRARHLLEFLQDPERDTILVGSSMGGYISLVATARSVSPVRGIFLMAPALYLAGYEVQSFPSPRCPIEMIHGWCDEVVPYQNSIRFAGETRAKLLLVDDDHRLSNSMDEIENLFERFLPSVTEPSRSRDGGI